MMSFLRALVGSFVGLGRDLGSAFATFGRAFVAAFTG